MRPVPVVLALLCVALVARAWRRRRASRRAQALDEELAGLLGALSLELRCGSAPADALAAATDGSAEVVTGLLAPALVCAVSGGAVGEVLLRAGHPLLRALGAAWQVSARAGAPLAEPVALLAAAARSDAAAREEVATALAGPRATAGVLAGLPALGVLLGAGLGAAPLHVLLATRPGDACLVVGALLEAAGLLWVGRLSRSAERRARR